MKERVLALDHRSDVIETRLGGVEDKLARLEDKLGRLVEDVAAIRYELTKKPTATAPSNMIPTALWALLATSALMYFLAGYLGRGGPVTPSQITINGRTSHGPPLR